MINTIFTILEQSLMHVPLMVGAYISFSLIKVPDLSIETAYVVGAILGSKVLVGMPCIPLVIQLPVVIVASLLGGAIVGLVSSSLTQKAKLPHLLSSIITFGLFHGFNQLICNAYVSLSAFASPLQMIPFHSQNPELPVFILVTLIIVMSCYCLFKKQLGYALAVYGNNPHFFKQYGISTQYIFMVGICISNALAGLSGYLFAQSNNFIELNMGLGKALLCITALILGKAIIRTTKPLALAIPIVGSFIYFILQQMLLKIGFNLKYFTTVQAFLVLIILVYTYRNKTMRDTNDNLGV